MKNMKNWVFLAGLAMIALFAAGCADKDLETYNNLEKDRFLVKTEKALTRDMEDSLAIVGTIKAMDEAVLYPRVSGKLLKNMLTEGDRVKKDQAVALIERDEPGVVYEPAPVPSTLNGVVGRIYQDSGVNVTPQTPIALVVSQGQVRVAVDLPERYVGRVFVGQSARIRVDAFPGASFPGKVYRVSPVVDTQSRCVVLEVLADNSGGNLKSGMFAEVSLVVGARSGAVAVPSSAVVEEGGRKYIFTPINGATAARREVKTGLANEEFTQITSGLRAGEDVIVFGLYGLKDGSKIKIEQ